MMAAVAFASAGGTSDKMKRWLQGRRKGTLASFFGVVALTFSLTTGVVNVFPTIETMNALVVGTRPPLICLTLQDHFIAIVSALVGLALFLFAFRRGEATNKLLGLIGVCLAAAVLIVFGIDFVQESIAYSNWKGWI